MVADELRPTAVGAVRVATTIAFVRVENRMAYNLRRWWPAAERLSIVVGQATAVGCHRGGPSRGRRLSAFSSAAIRRECDGLHHGKHGSETRSWTSVSEANFEQEEQCGSNWEFLLSRPPSLCLWA